MKTQSKLRKKGFTVVDQACYQIRGFKKLYEKMPVSTSEFQRTILVIVSRYITL